MGMKIKDEPAWLRNARKEGRVKDGPGVNREMVAAAATIANGGDIIKAHPKMTEATFQTLVIVLAELNGWDVYHTHDSRGSQEGYLDLTMVRDGVLCFVELKDEEGQPTPAQERWMEKLAATGSDVFLWRPSNWKALEEYLTRRAS